MASRTAYQAKMESSDADGMDPSVGFLYRDRDPKKRRVKPVQKHLLQVDFGEDNSDEDSDFQVDPNADSEEEEEVEADGEDDEVHSSASSSVRDLTMNDEEETGENEKAKKIESGSVVGKEDDKDDSSELPSDDESDSMEDSDVSDESEDDDRESSSESDESSEPGGKTQDMLISWGDGDSDDDEDYLPPDQRSDSKPSTPASQSECVTHRKEDIKDLHKVMISGEYAEVAKSGKNLKIVICQVCLGDISAEEDEIVECDGCGVSVHEGCYGISDNQSAASTESSASTEPWFCDACKAGIDNPHCELCPNLGGIFKETDAGKWVHIVCALYIPGVAFGDVDKLSPVTLFEMSYSKWGAKECSLCEDHKFSRTGVCVGCDAGMCRTHFHVTCAQREGLLSEASPDEDIADPFYAYCKQHAEKHIARKKRCNWLALQRNIKNHPKLEIEDEKERERVQRKLKRHCRKYLEYNVKKPPCWTPTEKMPRLLSSCPSALRRLNRKAELLGINTQLEQQSTNKDTRKKSYVSPAFSVEYVTYFIERNNKMSSMKNHTNDLQQQHSKLREQEAILRAKYDQLSNEMTGLRNSNATLRQEGEMMMKILGDMAGKTLATPEVLKVKKLTVQTSLPKNPTKKDGPISPNIGVILHKCSLCHRTSDQHMLARCDKCRLYYHLGCLDPPLSRMPKKTKQCGWQCSECAKTSSEDSDNAENNPDAPRKLRETIKEPSKFAPQQDRRYRGLLESCKPKKKGNRQVRVPSDHSDDSDVDQLPAKKRKVSERKEKPEAKKAVPKENVSTKDKDTKKEEGAKDEEKAGPAAPKRKRKPQVQPSYLFEAAQQLKAPMECVICLKPGDTNNMVRCDECTLCYHYGCLDPPLTKSPKRRGYSWHCAACDPRAHVSDYNDDSEDEIQDDKPKRKRAKKAPSTVKPVNEEKGTKKAEGMRTRHKAKDTSDSSPGGSTGKTVTEVTSVEKSGGEGKSGNEAQKNGKVHVKDVETTSGRKTNDKSTTKGEPGGKGEPNVGVSVKSGNGSINNTDEVAVKSGDKAETKPGDKVATRNGDKASSGKVGLRSRTPNKFDGKEAKDAVNGKNGVKGAGTVKNTGKNVDEKQVPKNEKEAQEERKATKKEGKPAKGEAKVVKEEENVDDSGKVSSNDGKVAKAIGQVAKAVGQVAKDDNKVANGASKVLKKVAKEEGSDARNEGKVAEPEGKTAKDEEKHEGVITKAEVAATKVVGTVTKAEGKVAKEEGKVAKVEGKVAKDEGNAAKDEDSCTGTKDENGAKKIDKMISSVCNKEVKIMVNRDLGNLGVGLKGKNGKSEEGNGVEKRDEGMKTKVVERVSTRATDSERVVTRTADSEKVVTRVSESERVSTRASSKSPAKAEVSKVGGNKKEGAADVPTKERTPKKEGSPKGDEKKVSATKASTDSRSKEGGKYM